MIMVTKGLTTLNEKNILRKKCGDQKPLKKRGKTEKPKE
jgi:hypothetical protein